MLMYNEHFDRSIRLDSGWNSFTQERTKVQRNSPLFNFYLLFTLDFVIHSFIHSLILFFSSSSSSFIAKLKQAILLICPIENYLITRVSNFKIPIFFLYTSSSSSSHRVNNWAIFVVCYFTHVLLINCFFNAERQFFR